VSDAALAAVATAACLHLAGGDKDFRVTAPSLNFPDAWGADLVMQVQCKLLGQPWILNWCTIKQRASCSLTRTAPIQSWLW
jgi:hypothetical protein